MSRRFFFKAVGMVVGISIASLQLRGADDIVINDFTERDYGAWKADGDAFGKGPLTGAELDKLGITNYQNFAVATSKPDDASRRPGTLTSPEFTIERPYISFLIAGASSQHALCMNLLLDGKIVRSATGAFVNRLNSTTWDVSALMGKKVAVQVLHNAADGGGYISVAHIVQTDHPDRLPVLKAPLYHEALRPQFHFTARQWTVDLPNPQQREEGWMNDPNGLIYYDREYHLFSQRWAECWIHAVSPDLIHWTELEPAFWETTHGSGCQSGTCVIDYGNTSGLSPDKNNPAMVAFWPTWDNKTQNICYSLDHGRTWKAYDKNPVLVHSERDPKVFWYEPTKSWVMFLYDADRYRVFTSKNLLSWEDQHSEIPNSHECPDFFQLPVDGDKSKMKWVLVRGNGLYSIGEFDGTKFTEETAQLPSDSGPNFYATQTWANTNTGDGRRVQIGWMQGGTYPNMPFNQQMTFPREFTLRTTSAGPRLFREPIKEIALLHGLENDWPSQELAKDSSMNLCPSGQTFHIKAEISILEGTKVIFHILGADLNLTNTTMECGNKVDVTGGLTYVEILVDRTSIEAFANHGEASLSRCFLPTREGISLECHGGVATLSSLRIFDVKSAWPADVK